MRASILLFASSLALASAQAGELVKQGSDSTTTYSVEVSTSEGQTEWYGIIRTESGDAMFDRLGIHTTDFGHRGKATIIDSHGDKIFTTYEGGASHYVGGTGKYAGISGEGTQTCSPLTAPDTGVLGICQGTSSWKLP